MKTSMSQQPATRTSPPNRAVSIAVALALQAGAFSLAGAQKAHAAGESADGEALEQVVVTGSRILRRDLAPGFAVAHFLKDLGIALAEARRLRLALPGLAIAEQLYRALEAQGQGASGIQALVVALGRLSAVDWP